MKIVIEITAEDDGDAAELWAEMLADFRTDPKQRLTLETRSFFSNVRFVEEA